MNDDNILNELVNSETYKRLLLDFGKNRSRYGLMKIDRHFALYDSLNRSGCGCKKRKLKLYWNESWKILHTITFIYPEKPTFSTKLRFIIFFDDLKDKLKCPECKQHYIKYLSDNPLQKVKNDKNSIIEWLFKLHNNINIKNNKKVLSKKDLHILYDKTTIMNTCKKYDIDYNKIYIL